MKNILKGWLIAIGQIFLFSVGLIAVGVAVKIVIGVALMFLAIMWIVVGGGKGDQP